jgi:hypothetical protein
MRGSQILAMVDLVDEFICKEDLRLPLDRWR